MGQDHHSPSRLDHASIGRDAHRQIVSADESIDDAAERLQTIIRESGPDAVGFYRGNSANKDVAGRSTAATLARQIGTRNIYSALTLDNVSKVAVSALITGHSFDGLMPIIDWDGARLVLIAGGNPVVSHGHDWATPNPIVRLQRVLGRGAVWVIDPRRTETARLASRHLAVRPGSDFAVFAFVIRELLVKGADRAYLDRHASGVAELREAVSQFDVHLASQISGIEPDQLYELAIAIRRSGVVAAKSGTGLSMSPSPAVAEWLLWAIQIVTHSFEQPGGCWFHPDFYTELDRQSYPTKSAVASPAPPTRPDLRAWRGERPCAAMADEIEAGNLRALLVYGGNPVVSLPDAARTMSALRLLDVLAVVDVQSSPTTDVATHVLPAYGSLERPDLNTTTARVAPVIFGQYAPRVLAATGDRRAMWWIFAEIGRRIGLDPLPDGLDPASSSDDDILSALLGHSPRYSLEQLREAPSGIQITSNPRGWVENRVLPEGRWQLAPRELTRQLDKLRHDGAAERPLILIPRRQPRHVNSKIPRWEDVKGEADEPLVVLNPADAAPRGVSEGERVSITSASGSLTARARLDDRMLTGAVSLPHGFVGTNVNQLTSTTESVDPLTGMPTFSCIHVDVSAVLTTDANTVPNANDW